MPSGKDISRSATHGKPGRAKKYSDLQKNSRIQFTHNGKTYEGSLYIVGGLGWKVWTYKPLEEIQADSTANLRSSAITAVVALVLSALMVHFLISMLIFKPLGKGVVFAAAGTLRRVPS